MSDRQALHLFLLFLALFHGAQFALVLLSPYDLAADEAHYWEWARRLDIAYYSKGPLAAILIAASTNLFGDTAFAVRLPALVSSALFSVVLFGWIRLMYGGAAGLLAVLLVRSCVFFAVLGLVATTDPYLMLAWLVTLAFSYAAIRYDRKWWLAAGLAIAIAILSKYTALILPASLIVFLLLSPELRQHILSPWFLAGMCLAALSLLPVVIWNMQHDWVNFQHNAAHLVSQKGVSFRPKYVFELVGAQFGLIGPVLVILLGLLLPGAIRAWRDGDYVAGLLVSTAVPLATVCVIVSLGKRVYANWPIPLFVSLLLLVVHLYFAAPRKKGWMGRWLGVGIALNIFLCLVVAFPIAGITFGLPAKVLTTKKLVGWSDLGITAARVRTRIDVPHFILAADYEHASALAFYMPSHPEVFVANMGDRRMNQYDIWGGLEHQAGRDALIVLDRTSHLEKLESYFESIESLGEQLDIRYSGDHIRTFFFYRGHGYTGKQFPPVSRR